MKRTKKTHINYSNFGISTAKRRQITVAYPLILGNEFKGGIIWETEQLATFKQIILPRSFQPKKYPFVQYRLPDWPDQVAANNQQFRSDNTFSPGVPDFAERRVLQQQLLIPPPP